MTTSKKEDSGVPVFNRTVFANPKTTITRKVTKSKKEDEDSSVPLCVKNTYSEGILGELCC